MKSQLHPVTVMEKPNMSRPKDMKARVITTKSTMLYRPLPGIAYHGVRPLGCKRMADGQDCYRVEAKRRSVTMEADIQS